ncbi:hypothetical protein MASR1M68_15140 [Elusimicrobiota bacterium]
MKRTFFAFLITVLAFTVVSAREVTPLVTKIIKSMETKEATIVDMSIDYTQTIVYFSTGEKQSTRGEIKMKDANIYMYQRQPKHQHTYIDGKKIITYIPANKQAVVDNWKDVLENDVLLATALNFSKNYKRAKLEYFISLIVQTDNEYCLDG